MRVNPVVEKIPLPDKNLLLLKIFLPILLRRIPQLNYRVNPAIEKESPLEA